MTGIAVIILIGYLYAISTLLLIRFCLIFSLLALWKISCQLHLLNLMILLMMSLFLFLTELLKRDFGFFRSIGQGTNAYQSLFDLDELEDSFGVFQFF